MAWTTIARPDLSKQRRKRKVSLSSYGGGNSWGGSSDNLNMLQQVYRGRYDRLERYKLYDWMDQDSDVSRALDLIAENATDKNKDEHFFEFEWVLDPTDEESTLIQENMTQWSRVNKWDKRMFRVIRNIMKYGDWFFFRNPDTFELYNLHPRFVLGALVDQESTDITAWVIRNFRFNTEHLELAVDNRGLQDTIKNLSMTSGMRNTKVIPAAHIVHISRSEGKFAGASGDDDPSDRYNNRWPFGESWLEMASKTFKQRELLEDSVLIHRVQRAPSRTVWYIDVGRQRADKANWAVNNFKNELNQKRIPQFLGNTMGDRTVDSVYNPISQLEDIYIPVSFEQRGSKVETLEGQPWNELPDLQYFTKKMMRGLRVPHTWMLGPEEGGSVFSDGRVGVAYQEEIQFSRFVSREQRTFEEMFDREFKLYCKFRDVNVGPADYELRFNPPDNFVEFRDNARDQDNIAVWQAIKDEPYVSKRKALEMYLKWSKDDIVESERMVLEETFSAKDAMAFGDMAGGGLGGGGLGAPLPGAPGAPMGLEGPGGLGELGGGDFGDVGGLGTPGDMAGGGMAMSGALPGGFGESQDYVNEPILFETEFSADDLSPVEVRTDDTPMDKSPDDKLFPLGANDALKGDMIITLDMVKNIRQSHMSRRVENEKRLKMIQKVYNQPTEGGGPLGGL